MSAVAAIMTTTLMIRIIMIRIIMIRIIITVMTTIIAIMGRITRTTIKMEKARIRHQSLLSNTTRTLSILSPSIGFLRPPNAAY